VRPFAFPPIRTLKVGGLIWRVTADAVDAVLLDTLRDPDRHFSSPDETWTHVGGVFVRRARVRRPWKLLKSAFRRSPAELAFRAGFRLLAAGIATPRPFAVTTVRIARLALRSILVTEWANHAASLDDWKGARLGVARATAVTIANLHELGFVHRDLSLRNLMIDAAGAVIVVDLDTLRGPVRLTDDDVLRDLSRFSRLARSGTRDSRGTRAAFLIEYCRRRRIADWRSWWKRTEELEAAETARLTRHAMREAPLSGVHMAVQG
jgi:tRNA A-37 threonylcarbamoyl transferase component Bud32